MADLTRTIQIIFEAVDDTGKGISAIAGAIGGMADDIGNVTQPLKDIATGLAAIDGAAAAMGITLAGVAVGAAKDFQTQVGEINTIVGLAPDKLKTFSTDILKYATNSTTSIGDINRAIYDATSAGVDWKDALDAVSAAEKLSVAGHSSLGEAMKLLIPTLNAFGTDMDDAGRFSDAFFQAVKLGVTTVPLLSGAMGQVAPQAAALNIPIETLAGSMALLTKNGLDTNIAATDLKAILTNLINPSKGAKDAAEALGIEFGADAIKTRGFETVLNDVVTATKGNVTEMGKMFTSTEALTGALILTKNKGEDLNVILGQMKDAAGSTDVAFGLMVNNLDNAKTRLGNIIDVVAIKFGTDLLPVVTKVAKDLGDVFIGVGTAVDAKAFDVPLGIVKQFLGDVDNLFIQFAANLPDALGQIDWGGFEDAMGDLRDAVLGLFKDVDITTPKGLADAIQGIVDVIKGITNVSSGVVTGLQPLLDIVGDVLTVFKDLNPETQKLIGWFIGMGTTVNILSGYASTLAGLFGQGGKLLQGFKDLSPALQAVSVAFAAFELGKMISDWTGVGDKVGLAVENFRGIPEVVNPSADALKRVPDELKRISEQTGFAIDDMDDFNQLANDGKIIWDDLSGSWVKAADASKDVSTETGKIVDVQKDLNPALKDQYDLMGLTADGAGRAADSLDSYKTKAGLLEADLKAGKISQEDYEGAMRDLEDQAWRNGISLDSLTGKTKLNAEETDKQKKSIKDAAEESRKMALEWEKLASQEREVIFKAAAEIAVAQIEADAKRAVAAMDMLAGSFKNTGDVLQKLLDVWAGIDNLGDKSKVEEWIKREYDLREKLAKAQIDLVQAEIERMKAQTELLDRGGVELKISSEGLEPALEAFMFAVIDKVRVQIAGSYEEFLLGCGG